MTIITPERMIFGRGVFAGAVHSAGFVGLVPDVTYLAHSGLTLQPSGVIQVTGQTGVGEWLLSVDVSLAAVANAVRTNVLVLATYNSIEIPSTRRVIYARQTGFGSTASLYARLTNLAMGDTIGLLAAFGGTNTVQVPSYGISGYMEKVIR